MYGYPEQFIPAPEEADVPALRRAPAAAPAMSGAARPAPSET